MLLLWLPAFGQGAGESAADAARRAYEREPVVSCPVGGGAGDTLQTSNPDIRIVLMPD